MLQSRLSFLACAAAGLFLSACSLLLPFEECSSDEDCAPGQTCSADKLCADGQVSCEQLVGPFDDDEALRLGIILPVSGEYAESGLDALLGIRLAVDEINARGGVGGLQNGRPLAFRVCDSQGDAAVGVEAAAYLVASGVPAIIGDAHSSVTLAIANEVTIPAGVLLISGSATASEIGGLIDQDLVWRTSPPDRFQARSIVYYAYWQMLERLAGDGDDAVHIAVLNYDDAYGRGLASEFRTGFEYQAEGDDPQWSLEERAYADGSAEELNAAAEWLRQQAPDIAVIIGFEEVAELLEGVVPELADTAFFLPDGARTGLLRTASKSFDPRPFLFGVFPASREGVGFDQFSAAFKNTYAIDPPVWSEHFYDAAYLVAFGLAGVDQPEPSGAELALAFKRLSDPDGSAVTVGALDLLAGMQKMGEGGSLDVEGASGKLDFDPSTGERQAVDILRWTYPLPDGVDFQECGIVDRFSSAGTEHDWCAAQCLPPAEPPDTCVPDTI